MNRFLSKFISSLPDGLTYNYLKAYAPENLWKLNPESAAIIALKKSCAFNSEDYLARYPEIKKWQFDPISHFIFIGLDQGFKFRLSEGSVLLEDLEKPYISILIPIYNNSNFVKKCLDSVLNQILKNIEIIILNDGSTEIETIQILKSYENIDRRLKIIHKKNSGYGKTLNIGLRISKGKYIGIVESDDFIEPDMYHSLYENAEKLDSDITKSGFFTYNTATNENRITNILGDRNLYYKNINIKAHKQIVRLAPAIWSAIYKKDFLDKNNIIFNETPGASFQDTSFHMKCFYLSKKIQYIREIGYHYRIDNENSSVKSDSKIFFISNEFDHAKNFLFDKNKNSELKDIFLYDRFRKFRWNYERLSEKSRKEFEHMYEDSISLVVNNDYLDEEEKIFVREEVIKRDIIPDIYENIRNDVEITVIIPFYNSEKYLERCVDSIRTQTFKNLEIILVNDGSSDSSKEIGEKLCNKDRRIILLNQDNMGAGAARNQGLKFARGRWLYFVDADDYFDPTVLEKLHKAALNNDADIAICKTQFISEKNGMTMKCEHAISKRLRNIRGVIEIEKYEGNIFTEIIGWAFDKLIKREVVLENKINFQEIRIHNDLTFVYSALASAKKIIIVNEILINKRHEIDGQISKTMNIYWPMLFDALKGLGYKLKKIGIYEIFEKNYIKYCIHMIDYYDSIMKNTIFYDFFLKEVEKFQKNYLFTKNT